MQEQLPSRLSILGQPPRARGSFDDKLTAVDLERGISLLVQRRGNYFVSEN